MTRCGLFVLALSSATAAEESFTARAVVFEHAPAFVLGPLSLEGAGTRPLGTPGTSAGRVVLTLPLGDWALRSYMQAQPTSDPEVAASIGLSWRSLSLECVVPELEGDPWQEPPAPVGVLMWQARF